MTEGGFGSGATMVNEAAAPIEEGRRLATMPGPKNQVAAWGARRDVFATHVRQHLSVLGPSALLEKLSSAHRWPTLAAQSVEGCRWHARLSLKEFAGLVHRDESVVRAWITAEEPPQIAAVIAVPVLQQPFLVAFAEELGAGADIETVIRVRRVAR